MARQHPDVPTTIVERLRLTCLDLPEVREERAWVGIRWVVAKKNFAHVLMIEAGYPPAYARAAGSAGPACVLTFRTAGPTSAIPRYQRAPFFSPPWFPNIVGLCLDEQTNWGEVAELLCTSYRVLAPKKLAESLDDS